jgi:phytoene/squalene synthetase
LEQFEKDYFDAYHAGLSLNPVLHSFQLTVKKYDIPEEHITSFLKSMKTDLEKKVYTSKSELNDYIYGSAEIVGLMCLKVFTNGDKKLYEELEKPAMHLGSAFQKVNFLRDLKDDIENLDRRYFPDVDKYSFNEKEKSLIIEDIQFDFDQALLGIKKLPKNSRLAVLVAYNYYLALLNKIKNTSAERIISSRVRVSNSKKLTLLAKTYTFNKFNFI